MSKSKAFTLIESMAVIGIIGILATLITVSSLRAQKNARDGRRKTDLYAIGQAFEARKLDKTCTESSKIGLYPITDTSPNATTDWIEIKFLASSNECNDFSTYLPTFPSSPTNNVNDRYDYNLTSDRKNYRVRASLENVTNLVTAECTLQNSIWTRTPFNGVETDCDAVENRIYFLTGN